MAAELRRRSCQDLRLSQVVMVLVGVCATVEVTVSSAILAEAGERRLMMCDDGGVILELLESSRWCCCCVCVWSRQERERGKRILRERERDSAEKRERESK
ncbi:hypothetical protein C1H46_035350 [Malus baccata]|uniref:Uncharacterized protein n=1 Tax=Malus baccata TaxID=106549 RepID=A0A540KXZ2_MALBA|nr:hypothetical protein C1H46_035350 [Malus baccata]